MGVYRRGRVLWIAYASPDGEKIRESTGQSEKRTAEALYRQRKREVANGTWTHPKLRGPASHPTVAEYAEGWIERQRDRGVRSIRAESQKLRAHVLPLIGARHFDELRPKDAIALVEALKRRETETGKGPLAPRTVRHCYAVFSRMARDATIDEVIAATPCVLPTGTLPPKVDRDPSWRARAIFTRAEVETLISDERIALDDRVFLALLFLLGLRHGEASGLRWEHYDREARPLGRMLITTQYGGARLKTDRAREMPVMPALAAILAEWRREGFASYLGRSPMPHDFVVPETSTQHGRRGQHRLQGTSLRRFGEYLDDLELRHRRQHDARRTLISLARTDGVDRDVLRACTHGESGDVLDGYTTFSWETKCRELAKLRIRRRGGELGHVPGHTASGGAHATAAISSSSKLPGEGLEPSEPCANEPDSRPISTDRRVAASCENEPFLDSADAEGTHAVPRGRRR